MDEKVVAEPIKVRRRKKYKKYKGGCCNHGSCDICVGNKVYQEVKEHLKMDENEKDL